VNSEDILAEAFGKAAKRDTREPAAKTGAANQRFAGARAFESVLDDCARPEDVIDQTEPHSPAAAFAAFAPPTDVGRQGGGESAGQWDQALDWIGDPEEAPAVKPWVPLSDDAEAIAAELGLARNLTLQELKWARRRFMWDNHPDRRRDAAPEIANRRVAVANMLIDRAEVALRKRGPN